jgi:hypothetical protein
LTTVFTAPVADAAAGAELPIWLAAVATDDPTAFTALTTADATGEAGLVPPEGGDEPAVPLAPPGELPGGAGEAGVPVNVDAPTRVTCPPGSLPEPGRPSEPVPVPVLDNRPEEPVAGAGEPPGVAEPVDGPADVGDPPCRDAGLCCCADTFDLGWSPAPAMIPAATSATSAQTEAIVP